MKKQEYHVAARYDAAYLDETDMVGDGLWHQRGRVTGTVQANNITEAEELIRQGVEARFPFCWRLDITGIRATPASTFALQEAEV